METLWHGAVGKLIDLGKAGEWIISKEKYLYVEYNVLDLVNEKAPMSKLEAVEYVEDRFQSLLDCTHSNTWDDWDEDESDELYYGRKG